MVITIDGPAGSGKSTVAKHLAKKLGMYYLYTGLLYRAVAYVLSEQYGETYFKGSKFGPFKIDPEDLAFINDFSYDHYDEHPVVLYQKNDISHHLLKPEMDQLASIVSSNKNVRDALLPLQRKIGKKYDIIADGRDCGTVVFPDAAHKFYLTADLDTRSQRILHGGRRKDVEVDFETVKQDLKSRDHRDMSREVAPLKKPNDAIEIDNSGMTIEQTVEEFFKHLHH